MLGLRVKINYEINSCKITSMVNTRKERYLVLQEPRAGKVRDIPPGSKNWARLKDPVGVRNAQRGKEVWSMQREQHRKTLGRKGAQKGRIQSLEW